MNSSVEIPEDIVGLDAASQELDRMIAADAAAAGKGQQTTDDSANDGQRATQAGTESTAAPKAESGKAKDNKADTTAEKPKTEQKPAEAAAPEKSRYQKATERQSKSWDELNAQKTAFKAEQDALKRDRETFQRERDEHKAALDKAEQKFTPEQYEAAADKFDDEGKPDLAELARTKAEQLRKNPPAARAAQADAKVETERKEWTHKAAVDFPELAKDRSPVQLRVAQLFKEDPDLKTHPKGIYVAARIASLEVKANEVSTLKSEAEQKDKALGELRARVKELEELTTPGGPGNATQLQGEKSFEQLSDTEQFQELERQAREVGPMTR